ncbi:MAG: pyridoxamine 5'-phosphate oxidase [Actinomycetes bacterium]
MEPTALAALRRSYGLAGLDEADVSPDPFAQFERWLGDAVAAELVEPNAMVLATADGDGRPSARTVLLKGAGPDGFVFFTNYGSRKARELMTNPQASLVFPWTALERQVVVVGDAEPLDAAANAAYFHARPHGHQVGAWASRQSEVVASREVLEAQFAAMTEKYPEGTSVAVPDFWGGFRVVATTVEFWQGRGNRLHDRIQYRRDGAAWVVERLSP